MSYDKSAKYYDLFGEKSDIEYYRNLGTEYGSALEIGVGTARVALELAEAGVTVWGIDNSEEMLDVARTNCGKKSADVQERIVLIHQDMVDFSIYRKFPLVYIPSSTFSHLLTTKDQLNCLKCIHEHLDENGVFAFDLELPQSSYGSALRLIDTKEVGDKTIVRWISNRPDYQDQSLETTLIFEVYTDQKLTERIIERSTVSLVYKRELLLLLDKAGFTVEHLYGDFQQSEDIEDLLVVEARKM